MIHRYSRRSTQPFAPVDCGAISAPSLLESELFGTLKGAYTGADRDRMGVLEVLPAEWSFLDEIGDIELAFHLEAAAFHAGARVVVVRWDRRGRGRWTCG